MDCSRPLIHLGAYVRVRSGMGTGVTMCGIEKYQILKLVISTLGIPTKNKSMAFKRKAINKHTRASFTGMGS